jgi:hypothetical protein
MPWEIDHELDALIQSGVVVTPKPDKALLWLAEQPPKQEQWTLLEE